ncbi:MAG: aminotransferase, partial [Acidimicrobiaceae bacterium]|nr:aminotransferase [Acidimicrobiaceae bacterium]
FGLMVNSGSSALRIAIDLLGLEHGDEIITSPLTFSTDVAPMVQSGLVPVFADITEDTYQIDVEAVEDMIGPRTRAILVPNLCGNCPDWDRLRAVADAHGLALVEDSCDVLDSYQRGRRTGERSDIGVTSFARSHAMTAGGTGGLVGIGDPDQYDLALSLRRWGRRSESYLYGSRKGRHDRFSALADGTPYDLVFVFDSIGYNFEPNELSSAYGLVQLDKLEEFNSRRRANWRRLDGFMADRPGVTPGRTTPETDTTWMRFCFEIGPDAPFDRAQAQEFLAERGVSTRMVWTGNILRQPGFAGIEHRAPAGGLPNCDGVMDRSLSLPIHHGLGPEHMDYICEQLEALFDRYS